MTITDNTPTIEDLPRELRETGLEVDELRNQFGALRDQLATEVRTRRLVVVDQNDREVIYTTITDKIAQLRVEWGDSDVGSCATAPGFVVGTTQRLIPYAFSFEFQGEVEEVSKPAPKHGRLDRASSATPTSAESCGCPTRLGESARLTRIRWRGVRDEPDVQQ